MSHLETRSDLTVHRRWRHGANAAVSSAWRAGHTQASGRVLDSLETLHQKPDLATIMALISLAKRTKHGRNHLEADRR